MKAAKTKSKPQSKAKPKATGASRAKAKRTKAKSAVAEVRAFRFTAAQAVQILLEGEKKPESFRVDDMAEASVVTQDGQAKLYFQYRLISNDRTEPNGSDRCFWFFDPKPVGAADALDPSLWQPVSEQSLDGFDVVKGSSGNFSTRSVTSYDGSGARLVVKLDDKPTYRMRLDLNGNRYFCESLPVTIRKGDVLFVPGSR